MGACTFRKVEKLRSEKHIQELFDKGSSFYLFPFKVFVAPHPDPEQQVHQVLISVSSRNFKRAVDRNLLKRRIRESYRLQKDTLAQHATLMIGFIYVHREIILSAEIKARLQTAMQRIPRMMREQKASGNPTN